MNTYVMNYIATEDLEARIDNSEVIHSHRAELEYDNNDL